MDKHARQTQKTEQIVYTATVLLNHIISPTALKPLKITAYKYYVQIFISWEQLFHSSWKHDWKPSLADTGKKKAVLFSEIHFEVEVKSPILSQSNVMVLSITTLVWLSQIRLENKY